MPIPTPIPPELFDRMAALDPRCDFNFNRRTEWPQGQGWSSIAAGSPAGLPSRRVWHIRVTLRERGGDLQAMHDTIEPTLAAALEGAITAAEAKGWHKPPPSHSA